MENSQKTDLQRINYMYLSNMSMPGNNQGDPNKEEKPPGTSQDKEDEKK